MITLLPCEDEITLFWDKPEREQLADLGTDGWNVSYSVSCSGCFTEEAQQERITRSFPRTHCTFTGLLPDTEYVFEVFMAGPDGRAICIGRIIGRTDGKKTVLDVTKAPYFACGDGKTLNTKVIQQALDDCDAGTRVYFPAGVYMTGALQVHSHTEIYLDKDALLQGTADFHDYEPRIPSRIGGEENISYSSLLNIGHLDHDSGFNCEDVLIRGKGAISSGGRLLAELIIADESIRLKDYIASLGDKIKTYENEWTLPGHVRPRLINISNACGVRLSGLHLSNGASWNVQMIYSKDIVTDHCFFESHDVWNGDGWDPDSSVNCTIFACEFHTGDDPIAIKSGKNREGYLLARPSEHIRIFDCSSTEGHGVAIGSEMSGGVSDVQVWDCDFERTIFGFEIKGTPKRGAYVRDVRIRDSIFPRFMVHCVYYNVAGDGVDITPVFSDYSVEDTKLTGIYQDKQGYPQFCQAIELCGFEEPGHEVQRVSFSNVSVGGNENLDETVSLQYTKDIHLDLKMI